MRWFVAILLSLASMPALACSCMMPIDLSRFEEIARAFESNDEVFSAYVEDVQSFETLPQEARWTDATQAQLRVLQVWKGPRSPGTLLPVFARHDPYLMNCAIDLARGEALMVYRNSDPATAGVSICSLSGPLFRALPDLPVLEQLAQRKPATAFFTTDIRSSPRPDWLPDLLLELYAAESSARDRARR